jgi:hypothetical protein
MHDSISNKLLLWHVISVLLFPSIFLANYIVILGQQMAFRRMELQFILLHLWEIWVQIVMVWLMTPLHEPIR